MSPTFNPPNCLLTSSILLRPYLFFFFFNDPATTEIYPFSLHDALPIYNSTTGVSISVDAAKFTDPVGNDNTASNTDTATVDTVNPTVVVGTDDSALKIGDVAHLTFTL